MGGWEEPITPLYLAVLALWRRQHHLGRAGLGLCQWVNPQGLLKRAELVVERTPVYEVLDMYLHC